MLMVCSYIVHISSCTWSVVAQLFSKLRLNIHRSYIRCDLVLRNSHPNSNWHRPSPVETARDLGLRLQDPFATQLPACHKRLWGKGWNRPPPGSLQSDTVNLSCEVANDFKAYLLRLDLQPQCWMCLRCSVFMCLPTMALAPRTIGMNLLEVAKQHSTAPKTCSWLHCYTITSWNLNHHEVSRPCPETGPIPACRLPKPAISQHWSRV